MHPTLALSEAFFIPALAIGGGLFVAVVGIVFGTVKSVLQIRAREATKREIAAYVAEGSISPDDAAKIIKADLPVWERGKDCA